MTLYLNLNRKYRFLSPLLSNDHAPPRSNFKANHPAAPTWFLLAPINLEFFV